MVVAVLWLVIRYQERRGNGRSGDVFDLRTFLGHLGKNDSYLIEIIIYIIFVVFCKRR